MHRCGGGDVLEAKSAKDANASAEVGVDVEIDEGELDRTNELMRGRLQTIFRILETELKRAGEPLAFERFIADMSLKFGMRRVLLREYVRTYESAGLIRIEDGYINATDGEESELKSTA